MGSGQISTSKAAATGGIGPATGARSESDLLLACARTRLDAQRAEQVARCLASKVDWEYLLGQADQHRLAPLLAHHLNGAFRESVPQAVLDRLCNNSRQSARRHLLLTSTLLDLLQLFRAHGVKAIPFKGPVLSLLAYGDLALREFWDLDLLIPEPDVPKARELVLSQGYDPEYRLNEAQQAAHLRFQYEYAFSRRVDGLQVEIQWRLAPRYFPFPLRPEDLWERQTELRFGGEALPSLSPEDLLLVLCAHGARHLWRRLILICDIAELVSRQRNLDWEWVMKQARELGSLRLLHLGLRLAADLLQANVPEEVLESGRHDPRVKVLAEQVRARLFQDAGERSSMGQALIPQLQMRERLRDKARFCLRLAATPNVEDWMRFPLPPRLMPLYYVLRPVRLAGKYGPLKRILPQTSSA